MSILTGSQALAKSLHSEGIRVVFGIPGVQLYQATNALYDEPDIRFITTRHEQGAAYMAFGFAAASGNIGTVMVVPGPGLLNTSAGVGTAFAASSPVLVISGAIPLDSLGKGRGELHEVDRQLETIGPVAKWTRSIASAEQIVPTIREAIRQIWTGRHGPVAIDIPPEALVEETDFVAQSPTMVSQPIPDRFRIQQVAKMLSSAERPVIWAGGGIVSSGACAELHRLAESLQAGVVTTIQAKGAISERNYLALGCPGYRRDALDDYLDSCDVVLAIGTRLSPARLSKRHRIIQIDVDSKVIGKHHNDTYGVIGDAKACLEVLYEEISDSEAHRDSRRDELEKVYTLRNDPSNAVEPQSSFVKAIREAIPDNGILVEGVTQVGYYSTCHYPAFYPRTYITSSYFVNLGFAYPTALGAKVAKPDKPVVAISGDGGFLFNSQEMATAVKYGINAVVVVFNDNAFGNVKRDQRLKFDGRQIGVSLHNPDFVELAEAYGLTGMRVADPGELQSTLSQALDMKSPVLIEVPVEEMPEPW